EAVDGRSSLRTSNDFTAYENPEDVPQQSERIIVDKNNEAILIPYEDKMIPFHVSTVKTVTTQANTTRKPYIRITFNPLGTHFSSHDPNLSMIMSQIHVKEVSVCSKDLEHLRELEHEIKTLKREFVSRESERADKASLVTQEKLVLAGRKFKPLKLIDLWIRPPLPGRGRKIRGTLESHENGFRYSTSRANKRVDILFGGSRRSAYDPDEIEEEHRERARKTKSVWTFRALLIALMNFGNNLCSEVPTASCLVELIETPFLMVTLSEIEIVNLERVRLRQKNFYMAIVFKDFKRDVFRIDSIPSASLEGIKEWLDTADIKYYESRFNTSWRTVLKTIMDDPKMFINEKGWEFLNSEASDSDSDSSAYESDQGYTPSDAELESDDEESDSASLVESEDDEDEEEEMEESEEEVGKTWEELEHDATNADREKGDESDSEDERERKKMKAFGKSRAGPSTSAPKRPNFRR
nr:hypothetical protein [Tanacetum cinerariifolium]